ncbi:MAG: N-acetylneuraminate lyase [Ruminococcaceae bacterium]|nr:N-acetylneuraminate lyase [Oscillospiraceae bacterium]
MKGIYTALLTPFDENNRIHEKALEQLILHNIKMGVQGFYVGGSTAEAFLLSTDERKQVMDICRAVAPNHRLIAHIGSLNEAEALALSLHARALGYDAISSVSPFYYKFTFAEIRDYYFRLAEHSGMPMIIYHFPAFTGVSMGMKEIGTFLDRAEFIGMKFTSNDFFTLEQVRAAFPDKLIYNGYDEMFLAGLAMGADGGVGSTYNFMADKFVRIQTLFWESRIAEAQALQREANRIIAILCRISVMQAEKEVLNQLGIPFGTCRKPFGEPSAEQKALIAKEIIPYITAL